jgi:hypothetical protein
MRGTLVRLTVLRLGSDTPSFPMIRGIVIICKIETIRSRVGYLFAGLTGSTLAKVWVSDNDQKLKVRATPTGDGASATGQCKAGNQMGSEYMFSDLVERNWLVAAKRS